MKTQDNFLYIKKPNGRYAIAEADRVVESAQEIVASHYNRSGETPIFSPQPHHSDM